jgi:protein-glutamine gamma-glutamyltransferase
MTVPDGSVDRSEPVGVGRVRPAGWSPGTGTLFGAWIASAAIARLTGASAVILLLAAGLVAMSFEVVAGWRSARTTGVADVVAPTVANVGEGIELLVTIDAPTTVRSIERRRIAVALPDGTVVSLHDEPTTARPTTSDAQPATHAVIIPARFETPGVVTELTVRVDVAGPGGLIWWTRVRTIVIDPVHVAPVARGPAVAVESSTSTSEGSFAARRGNHGGEIDGVRPWRPGDGTNSVHWMSSLRTDELIVHDRLTAADQRWLVDLDAGDPSRLRWTFDEGRRQGYDVTVQTGDGARHAVRDENAAARWSAVAAQRRADTRRADTEGVDATSGGGRPRVGILHRQIRLQPAVTETTTAITGPTRWAAAAAAFASMAMLTGATGGSATMLGVVLGAVVAGAAVSLWVARRGGRRPLIMQVAIVVAIVIALAVIAAHAVEVDGLLAALRGPLPDLLMLLVVLHGFETVDRRTVRVHLAITFVLTSYAAGLRIDAALGWWLVAWAVPFAVSMLTTLRRPRNAAGQAALPPRSGVPPRRRLVGSARITGRWLASIVGICAATLAVLSLVPIPDGPARLGLPALSSNAPIVDSPGGLARPDGSMPSSGVSDLDRALAGGVVGYPGFTETLDTSIRGELGDEIVMRVRAPEPAFWRGQTFTEFDGRTWTVSPELGRPRAGPVIDVPPTLGDALASAVPSRELVQTYFVEQDLPNLVFAAPRAVQVIFDGSLWTRPDGALRSDVTLTAGSVYTVVSERPLVDADILRAQGDLGEFFAGFRAVAGGDELDPFLELPASTTQRTIDLATTLRTPGESTYDTILAYEAWLGANTEYDLDAPVPEAGADAVDDFLFESQLGFCEQIASTLTIMLRSQGVPARLATGYVPGERDRVSGVWNVRGSDAHAWVEVWFPQTGWQPFDPTAEVPLAADAGGETVGGDLIGAMVSSIVSYRIEIGSVLLAAAVAWVLVLVATLARYRRRRGRWGLLQDRFGALADGPRTTTVAGPGAATEGVPTVATNAHIASGFADAAHAEAARHVADELDRAGFDPSWVDDDERYERARSALATLERSRR